MRTGITLMVIFGLSLAFTMYHTPKDAPLYDFFLFSNAEMSIEAYAYFIFEHWFLIAILFMWFKETSDENEGTLRLFLYLQFFDFIDFILTANKEYGNTIISFNMISILIFGLYLLNKWVKQEWKT